jgi:hypothetical protein
MKIMSLAMAAGLSAIFAVSSVIPAQALQIALPQIEKQASTNIVQARVKWRKGHRWHRARHWHGGRYHHRRHWHRGYWRAGIWIGPAVVLKVGPGYRSRHVRWCRNHYASYRKWDNSWKTNGGQRRVCVSPFRR